MPKEPGQTEELDTFLTPQEVSEMLRVSIYTVRRWINEGRLPAYKFGRVWRIRSADFEVWLSHQANPSVPTTDVSLD